MTRVLNKVDVAVKELLLRYPNLHSSRFDAMATLLTNSSYEWQDGCIVDTYRNDSRPATVEAMLKQYVDRRTETEAMVKKCSSEDLNEQWLIEADYNTHIAEFRAKHIDVFAQTYVTADYQAIWVWLWTAYRHQLVTNKYWPINNPPEAIDEEWRVAIRQWLGQLKAPANSIFGYYTDRHDCKSRWKAIPTYATVFSWIYDTDAKYTNDADRERDKASMEIIDKILAERE